MYESHFGLTGQPFALNPDPAFYFNSRGHGRALSYLQYGVAQGEGFIVITGEIGAGKTTLVRTLLEGLDRQKVLPAQIVSTQLEAGELLQAIIAGFGIPAQGSSKAHLLATLEAFLTALAAQGRHALLIVDEAQNLAAPVVEELRMLSNFQLGNKALLQSFLVGQPQLRKLLESPDMEQLRQRVMASYHLGPLSVDETRGYVEHRLRRVGWDGVRPQFEPLAFAHLFRWTGGVPRRLNRLCNRALLAAYLDGVDVITPHLVERTADELRSEIGEGDFDPLPLPEMAPITAVIDDRGVAASPAGLRDDASLAPEVRIEAPAMSVDSAALPLPEVLVDGITASQVVRAIPAAEPPSSEDAVGSVIAPLASADDAVALTEAQAGVLIDDVIDSLHQLAPVDLDTSIEVVRQGELRAGPAVRPVVLCLVDSQADALKFAAIVQADRANPAGPRFVLVNARSKDVVWPWGRMDRLLPALELGLHLNLDHTSFESVLAGAARRFAHVLDECKPVAMMAMRASDALFACALVADKRGLPLLLLQGSDQGDAADSDDSNLCWMESAADLVLTSADRGGLTRLQQRNVDPERVVPWVGDLVSDTLWTVWREVSTAYRAFMRHAMPIYLGPTWSEHAGAGTPYALVSLSLEGVDVKRAEVTCVALLALADLFAAATRQAGVTGLPKLVWLTDEATQARLADLLPSNADIDQRICLVLGEGPRSTAMRAKMDAATVLCRTVDALPDQLSILQGSSWALVAPGQVLAEAVDALEVPAMTLSPQGLLTLTQGAFDNRVMTTADGELPPVSYALGSADPSLGAWMEWAMQQSRREQPREATGAPAAVLAHVQTFVAALRPAGATVSALVATDVVQDPVA